MRPRSRRGGQRPAGQLGRAGRRAGGDGAVDETPRDAESGDPERCDGDQRANDEAVTHHSPAYTVLALIG